MEGLRKYHADLLGKIYGGSLYGGASRLDSMWPLIVGGAVFAAINILLKPAGALRFALLAILLAPGVLWAAYLFFHELKSLPAKYRRHKDALGRE